MSAESCSVCGGDGQLQNSFGSSARCPACHGSGRRSDDGGMRDVTKTKPSHHHPAVSPGAAAKATLPTTFEGLRLANEINACVTLSAEARTRLVREVMEYEGSHGKCTQTFTKKIRRQLRPA